MTKRKSDVSKFPITLEEIVRQLPGHVYWKDADGKVWGCNERNYRDFGMRSLAEYVGKTESDFFDQEQAGFMMQVDRKVMDDGEELVVEEFADNYNGETKLYLSHKIPLRDVKNKVVGLAGISLDVTRDRQEEMERLYLLESIINFIPAHVYWKDLNNIYLGCNNSQAKALGLRSNKDIVGTEPYTKLSQQDAELLRSHDRIVFDEGKTITVEEPSLRDDGTYGMFLTNKAPLRSKDGELIGMLGVSVDITEQKKIEKEKREAEEAKTQFIQNMEHDLRTPSSGIAQLISILEEQELDPQKRLLLNKVGKASRRLLETLNGILEFDKADSFNSPILYKKFDLRELVGGILEMEDPAASNKGLELVFICSDDIPEVLVGDNARLHRILLNLISNAVKFTLKGFVKVIVDMLPGEKPKQVFLRFVVEDTGIGIPEDKQNIIYERFARCVPANRGLYSGSGLGLSIVKKLVNDLGGEIEVKSELGVGTIFTCVLPFEMPLISKGV